MEVDPRVVQVFCTFSDGRRSTTGSGYLLDGGLVLTAAHVVGADQVENGAPRVQFIGSADRHDCAVAWHAYERARPERVRMDAAVLRITDPAWRQPTDLPPLRWGRLVTNRPDIPVLLNGFPTAMDARDEHGTLLIRDLARVSGVVSVGTSAKGRRYHVTVNRPLPPSATADHSRWEGLSGAALICDGLVLGATAEARSEPDWAWLSVVPTPVLLEQPGFRELVGPVDLEPGELQPILEQPGIRQMNSPVSLLRAENAVVGFDHARDEFVNRLRDWCIGEGWFSIRLLTGPGGQGKTRLAARLVTIMRELGWSCGFLHDRAVRPELGVVGDLTTPVLLVIDYAETRTGQLVDLLDVVDRRTRRSDGAGGVSGAPAVRVLLLARDGGDWWEEARSESLLLRDLGPGAVLALPDLYAEERREPALRGVVRDLARVLDRLPDYAGPYDERLVESLPLPSLTGSRFARALDLHMAGLVALLQARRPEAVDTADEPDEAVLLRHEQRFWRKVADRFGLTDLSLADRRRLVATATLCVARDTDHAADILSRLTSPSAAEALDATARWLAALYPADRDFWGPLRPDRIGEYLVGLALSDTPALLDQLLPTAERDEALGAMYVLARATSHQAHVAEPLQRVITANPAKLAPTAITAATAVEHPEPLHSALTTVVDEGQDDLALLDGIYQAVPNHSQTLALLAVELAGRVTELVASDVEAGMQGFPDLATAFTHHAFRLNAAGYPEFALPRYAMAVQFGRSERGMPGVRDRAVAMQRYTDAKRPGRVLLAVDVSGSMNEPTGNSGTTRFTVAWDAAVASRDYMDKGRDQLGLWLFSTRAGPSWVQEVLPIGGNVDTLNRATGAQWRPNGDTPLYRTMTAGVRAVGAGAGDSVNALVVLTDGEDTVSQDWLDDLHLAIAENPDVRVFLIAISDVSCDTALFSQLANDTAGQCLSATADTVGDTLAALFRILWTKG